MKTAGSEKIVHGPDGTTWIVRGNDDGTYTAMRCEVTAETTFQRSWQAVKAVKEGNADTAAGKSSLVRLAEIGQAAVEHRTLELAALRGPHRGDAELRRALADRGLEAARGRRDRLIAWEMSR